MIKAHMQKHLELIRNLDVATHKPKINKEEWDKEYEDALASVIFHSGLSVLKLGRWIVTGDTLQKEANRVESLLDLTGFVQGDLDPDVDPKGPIIQTLVLSGGTYNWQMQTDKNLKEVHVDQVIAILENTCRLLPLRFLQP